MLSAHTEEWWLRNWLCGMWVGLINSKAESPKGDLAEIHVGESWMFIILVEVFQIPVFQWIFFCLFFCFWFSSKFSINLWRVRVGEVVWMSISINHAGLLIPSYPQGAWCSLSRSHISSFLERNFWSARIRQEREQRPVAESGGTFYTVFELCSLFCCPELSTLRCLGSPF